MPLALDPLDCFLVSRDPRLATRYCDSRFGSPPVGTFSGGASI